MQFAALKALQLEQLEMVQQHSASTAQAIQAQLQVKIYGLGGFTLF